ncbi:Predicted Fe-S oxidoreductases [Butyrivibrio fibrisolvens 16/4]|nr:Predicted Fe-S oxidoreductases [Butyrivibrio fibrisolvens 16/4]
MNIKWDITYKCNLNCEHCINGDFLGQIEDELSTEEVFNIIEKLAKEGVERVHLLGGEPTARKDIKDIFKCFEKNNLEFGFNTNGLKLSDDNLCKEIVSNNALKNIVISLEGPNEFLNDQIRGKKVFGITKSNLEKIIKLKEENNRNDLSITVNTVVSSLNIDSIPEMIDFCVAERVNQLVLLQMLPGGNAKDKNYEISIEQSLRLVDLVAQKYEEVKKVLEITPRFIPPLAERYANVVLGKEFPKGFQMCGAGTNFFYINNSGLLFPCDRYRGNILEKNKEKNLRLQNGDFWNIASNPGYGDIFEITEGDNPFEKCTCNKCDCFRNTCYPCVLSSKMGDRLCKTMMEEIEKCIV